MAFELLRQLCSYKCKPFKLCPTALKCLPKGFVIKRQTYPPLKGKGRLAFSWLPRNHHHLLESSWAWPGADTYHRWHCAHDEDSSYGQGALGIGDDPRAQISNSTKLWFLSSPTVQPRSQLRLPAICHLTHDSQVICVFRQGKWSVIPSLLNIKIPPDFMSLVFPYFFSYPHPHPIVKQQRGFSERHKITYAHTIFTGLEN